LPSQVAAVVPEGQKEDGKWNAKELLNPGVGHVSKTTEYLLTMLQDERRMARFAQYAMVASEEALNDAGWSPKSEEDLESTVSTTNS
jgi:3-oxoacyl-[acyl-carrier-protein] synthase II